MNGRKTWLLFSCLLTFAVPVRHNYWKLQPCVCVCLPIYNIVFYIFKLIYLCMCVGLSVYISIWLQEVKRRSWIPWKWSDKQLWAVWHGCWEWNLGPLEDVTSLPSHWAIFPAFTVLFFQTHSFWNIVLLFTVLMTEASVCVCEVCVWGVCVWGVCVWGVCVCEGCVCEGCVCEVCVWGMCVWGVCVWVYVYVYEGCVCVWGVCVWVYVYEGCVCVWGVCVCVRCACVRCACVRCVCVSVCVWVVCVCVSVCVWGVCVCVCVCGVCVCVCVCVCVSALLLSCTQLLFHCLDWYCT
jgi:hypothetical protein